MVIVYHCQIVESFTPVAMITQMGVPLFIAVNGALLLTKERPTPYFLKKYFPDHDNLIEGIYPIELQFDTEKMEQMFCGGNYAEDYKILTREIRKYKENIPPLINSYMNISPSMRVFGTVTNPDFGGVEETGILITINDIYPVKSERHFKMVK